MTNQDKPMTVLELEALIKQAEIDAQIKTLEKVLSNGHGGGNWRRLIITEIEKLTKEKVKGE